MRKILEQIIEYAIKNQCSDIHITEGHRPRVRRVGEIDFIPGMPIVTKEDIGRFFMRRLPPWLDDKIKTNNPLQEDIDTSFEYCNRRIRANIFVGISGINIALRILGERVPKINELNLPPSIESLTKLSSGLVIVVGVTGSGKTTTLASIIDSINHNRKMNIISIEDPIEYIYIPDKSRIEQRELYTHTPSFSAAIKGAMRQDPNVILIGELRDLDTISSALTLAETGHLVFCTLHAKSVPDTIDRIIDVFPAEAKEQIRYQLSSVLRCIIYQKLIPDLKGGMLPLVEILISDDVIAGMIRQKQSFNSVRDYLRSQRTSGNVHLVDNVVWHCKNGRITLESIKNILIPNDYTIANTILLNGRQNIYTWEGGKKDVPW